MIMFAGWRATASDPPDVFTEDVTRFTELLAGPVAERRVEGLQGLSHLKHWPAEENLLRLLGDPAVAVRREAVLALGRLGTGRSIPHLLRLLDDPSWEQRENARLALARMTAQNFPAEPPDQWRRWWDTTGLTNLEQTLLAGARTSPPPARLSALRALRHLATPGSEGALTTLLGQPGLRLEERTLVAQALERVGSTNAIPALAGVPSEAAVWALGRLGGPAAEQALLRFPKALPVLVNLDRLHSTNAGPFIPHLVAQMGLVTYRGQPDDLMNRDAQPIQRVGANLIRRSGRAAELMEQVLLELEYTMQPPRASPRPPMPAEWKPMLEAMRSELKPGFVREDGVTTSQPLAALYHVASPDDQALARRLLPLLRHPAFVPRLYVALTLAKLRAPEALPALLGIIREGYPFSDAVALASGKHFDQSQTVRWRGFLCMALGRYGGDEARAALEAFAADPGQPRDIRYSAVVGLNFIASPESLPALRRVAATDIIWMVRDEARRAAADIEVLAAEGGR
jgi:HEAT repeat protein